MAHIQTAIGAGVDNDQTASASGSVVGSGHSVVGFAAWYFGSAFTPVIYDDKGNTYSITETITDGASQYVTQFFLNNITNGPSVITLSLAPNFVYYLQVGWSEYSSITGLVGYSGATQVTPGTGTDAISSGSITPSSYPVTLWGAGLCNASTSSPGTGFTQRATGPYYLPVVEDRTLSSGSAAATFTNAASGGTGATFLTLASALSGALPPSIILDKRRRRLRLKRARQIVARKKLPLPIISPARVIPSRRPQPRAHWLRPHKVKRHPRPLSRPMAFPFPRVIPPAVYSQGIAFRATGGYVTDVIGWDYSSGGGYPQSTKQGNIVGFTVTYPTVVAQNETTAQDPRLAGNLYNNF